MDYDYNYWAITASAVTSFLIGFIWFSMIFKESYIEGLGNTQQQPDQKTPVPALLQLLGNMVFAVVLSWLLKKSGCVTVMQSIQFAALLWMGFIVSVLGPLYAYQAYSFKFFLIIAGAILMYFLITAILLTVWK